MRKSGPAVPPKKKKTGKEKLAEFDARQMKELYKGSGKKPPKSAVIITTTVKKKPAPKRNPHKGGR